MASALFPPPLNCGVLQARLHAELESSLPNLNLTDTLALDTDGQLPSGELEYYSARNEWLTQHWKREAANSKERHTSSFIYEGTYFHNLPVELLMRILDIAAASSKNFALSLSLVASWTRPMAIRHLLRTLTFSDEAHTISFYEQISRSSGKPRSPFLSIANATRTLRAFWTDVYATDGEVELLAASYTHALLSNSPYLNSLAISPSFLVFLLHFQRPLNFPSPSLHAPSASKPEVYLALTGHSTSFPSTRDHTWLATLISCTHPPAAHLFTHITHLTLWTYLPPSLSTHFATRFTSLTHLALLPHSCTFYNTPSTLLLPFTQSSTLKKLVILDLLDAKPPGDPTMPEYASWMQDACELDPRVYIYECYKTRLETVWKERLTAHGEETIWDLAFRFEEYGYDLSRREVKRVGPNFVF